MDGWMDGYVIIHTILGGSMQRLMKLLEDRDPEVHRNLVIV